VVIPAKRALAILSSTSVEWHGLPEGSQADQVSTSDRSPHTLNYCTRPLDAPEQRLEDDDRPTRLVTLCGQWGT
jgi:hypothetical protein